MPLGRNLVVEFIRTVFLVFTVATATNPKTTSSGRQERLNGDGANAAALASTSRMLVVISRQHARVTDPADPQS